MKVAVTGAAGYLGRTLVRILVDAGHEVTAADQATEPGLDADRVRWYRLDVLDPDRVAALLRGQEVVFHLAAKITLHDRDDAAWRLNTAGVRTVARAALEAGVRRFVHCSSVHSFDTSAPGVLSESSPRSAPGTPLPLYDRSKHAGEVALHRVMDDGLDAVIANPTGVFGAPDAPGQLSRMNDMLRDAALGRVPATIAGGFDWVDVRDACTGLLQAAEHGRRGENYLLGGHALPISTAFRMAARSVGRRGPLFTLPHAVVRAVVPLATRIGKRMGSDIMTQAAMSALQWAPVVDHAKARRELGYRARSSEETIRDLVAWFVTTGQLDPGANE